MAVGTVDGEAVGLMVGRGDGLSVGILVGVLVGLLVGMSVGVTVGTRVVCGVSYERKGLNGGSDGIAVGTFEGWLDG